MSALDDILWPFQVGRRRRARPDHFKAARTAARRRARCLDRNCHGSCGRKPTRGAERSTAKTHRRRREQIARASRKANR